MADPKQTELLKQLTAAWEQAQRQLVALRKQVEQTTELAHAKVQANGLARELDRAYRDFGEAVWTLVRRGRISLPPSLAAAQRQMQEAQRKVDTQNEEIADLLRETEVEQPPARNDGARVRKDSNRSDKTVLAPRPKKR